MPEMTQPSDVLTPPPTASTSMEANVVAIIIAASEYPSVSLCSLRLSLCVPFAGVGSEEQFLLQPLAENNKTLKRAPLPQGKIPFVPFFLGFPGSIIISLALGSAGAGGLISPQVLHLPCCAMSVQSGSGNATFLSCCERYFGGRGREGEHLPLPLHNRIFRGTKHPSLPLI